MHLSEMGLGRAMGVLGRHGIETSDDLVALNERELKALAGMGPKTALIVLEELDRQGLVLAHDPWAPYMCARHGATGWDVGLSSMFLCDECAHDFATRAFDGQPAEWIGEPTGGFCLNCNLEKTDVRLRQWLLCGTCERVARSIGRSVVAARYVADRWGAMADEAGLDIRVEETDIPVLMRRSKENIAAKVSHADFIGYDTSDEPVFGIEMKTGRSYVRGTAVGSKIATFQLDTSDCDDILTVAERDQIPIYLAHVQVIDRANAPTIRYQPLGFWWTDLFSMRDNFIEARMRPREARAAAYYRTDMFRDADDLIGHIEAGGPRSIQQRIDQEGLPAIYRLGPRPEPA